MERDFGASGNAGRTTASSSLSDEYFYEVYAASDDPWHFETSAYEAEKYASTIAILGPERFERGFEIGCSIGVLTAKLAERCDELVAVDINHKPLAIARKRLASNSHVHFFRMTVPHEFPEGQFDLVVISEVGYYWSDADLGRVRDHLIEYGPGTIVELVHYLPKVDDYLRDGDAVHEAFLSDDRYEPVRSSRAEQYRIDVLRVR